MAALALAPQPVVLLSKAPLGLEASSVLAQGGIAASIGADDDASLHLVQPDGYSHAADLRTTGRGFLRNRLVQLYLWGLGFDTRRHTGTSDHLHVELPVR